MVQPDSSVAKKIKITRMDHKLGVFVPLTACYEWRPGAFTSG